MSSRWLVSLLILCTWFGIAAAQRSPTTLRGRVTDVMGRPVSGARIHVLASGGDPLQTETARDGRYRVALPAGGAYKVVFAIDGVHTLRTVLVEEHTATTLDVAVETDTSGGEVINIVEPKPKQPKVPAKSKAPPRQALPYSDEAVTRDAWARAWLLLDVDASGQVTRLKLLKAPGFDLDRIAIEEGLKLRFEPARDDRGRAVRTYVVYSMEWPAWGWVIQGNGVAVRPNDANALHAWSKTSAEGRLRDDIVPTGQMTGGGAAPLSGGATAAGEKIVSGSNVGRAYWAAPPATSFSPALDRVPCVGTEGLNLDMRNRAYRDCSTYDLTKVDALPWITRETVDAAVAALAMQREQVVEISAPPPSRVPDVIATAATGAMLAGVLVAHLRFREANREVTELASAGALDHDAYNDAVDRRHRLWNIRTGLAVGTVLTGATAVLLWTRSTPKSSFSVQPTNDGAAASFATTF